MIDHIRSLARSGERDKARQMLSQLQRTLENMRAGGAKLPSTSGRAAKAMDDMQRLTKAQGDLLNSVFNLANQISGPGQERIADSTNDKGSGPQATESKADRESKGDREFQHAVCANMVHELIAKFISPW